MRCGAREGMDRVMVPIQEDLALPAGVSFFHRCKAEG
jgi:hypothetical protein